MKTNNLRKGVGGWLMLLCISLTVFTPMLLLRASFESTKVGVDVWDQFPIFARLLIGFQVLHAALAGYSFWAGISLWQEKQAAVWRAQKFLILYVGFMVIRIVIPYLSDLPLVARDDLVVTYGKLALRSFPFVIVWYLYLEFSVRVRNTYTK